MASQSLRLKPTFLILLIGLLVPFMGFSVVNLGSFGIQFGYVAGFMLIVYFLLFRMNPFLKIIRPVLHLTVIGIFIGASVSGVGLFGAMETDYSEFIKSLVHLSFYLIIFTCMINIRLSEDGLLSVFKGIISLGFAICGYGYYQFFARMFDWPLAYLPFNNASFNEGVVTTKFFNLLIRPASVFLEPSHLGVYLLDLLLLFCICWIYRPDMFIRNKIIRILFLMAIIGLFFMTFSMGAILNLAIVGFFVFALLKFRGKTRIISSGIIFIGLFMFVLNFGIQFFLGFNLLEFFGSRAWNIFAQIAFGDSALMGDSLPTRAASIARAFDLWMLHPFFGVGIGNFGHYAEKAGAFGFTDSALLNILSEQGLFGLLTYAAFFVALIFPLTRYLRSGCDTRSILGRAMFFLLLAHLAELCLTLGSVLSLREWFTFGLAAIVALPETGKVSYEYPPDQSSLPVSS